MWTGTCKTTGSVVWDYGVMSNTERGVWETKENVCYGDHSALGPGSTQ